MSHRDLSTLLVEEPDTAAATATYKAVVAAYRLGETIQTIMSAFDVTRTDIALIIDHSGIRRGLNPPNLTDEDAKNLYALLYAAQLEIAELRQQLREK